MYSLRLTCLPKQVESLSADLWEAETAGVREEDLPDGRVSLTATFERNDTREKLLTRFRQFSPQWTTEADTDWVAQTRTAWPGRSIGKGFFVAAPWCEEPIPSGRIRLLHNPGLACGTGEHPCTRLALAALEQVITPKCTAADIGTGSGILAIAAIQLGASLAIGIDLDFSALEAAGENFALNQIPFELAAGSADCLRSECADVVVANISPSVLLAISDDLLRIARPGGAFVLTGFEQHEAITIGDIFPPAQTLGEEGWACVISRASS